MIWIREAEMRDLQALAEIHVQAWREAYKGLMPEGFLAELCVEERIESWRQRLQGCEWTTLVAEDVGQVHGWVSFGFRCDEAAESDVGEIVALNVAPFAWGRGCGSALCAEAGQRLELEGARAAMLWVLRDNARAIRFYRRLGFVQDAGAERFLEVGGLPLSEVRFRRDLGRGPVVPRDEPAG